MDHANTTIAELFLDTSERHGARPAIIGVERPMTYGELRARVVAAASALLAAGIGKGDRVAIWLPNSAEWIEAGLAVALLGAIAVPVSTRLKGEEVGYILRKSRPKAVVAIGEFLGVDYTRMITRQDFPGVAAWFRISGGDPAWTQWSAALDAAPDQTTTVLTMAKAVKPSDHYEIMFTSGTTGFPKGAMLMHSQIVRCYSLWAHELKFAPTDKYLVIAPMFHSFGYKAGVIASIVGGCAIYPLAAFDARRVLEIVEAEGITITGGPPTIFISMLDENRTAKRKIGSLRAIGTGGNIVPPQMIRELQEIGVTGILNAYGLTETTALVTMTDPADDPDRIAQTAGTVIPGVEVRCADRNDVPVPVGEPGEIQVRGFDVMAGYFEDDAATRAATTADGWLKTGDVGILDAQGYLKITDRMKDMYVVGGFNCYPAEIERIILDYPGIDQVAVIGIPDERMGEVGKAVLVLKSGTVFDSAKFLLWCRDKMANYKVPREVSVVDALPRNAMGKVQKFLLRK